MIKCYAHFLGFWVFHVFIIHDIVNNLPNMHVVRALACEGILQFMKTIPRIMVSSVFISVSVIEACNIVRGCYRYTDELWSLHYAGDSPGTPVHP